MKIDKKDIIRISGAPERIPEAAQWFSGKWGIPLEAYLESMQSALVNTRGVPQWYIITNGDGRIIAGIGIIDNDFHKRVDLSPNLCALYVEREYRGCGIARLLLDNACEDLASFGVETAYLLTGHTELYERCGWEFLTRAEQDDGEFNRIYERPTEQKS